MPGTVKIWYHDGATSDIRYNDLPVVNEPELGFETLIVGSTPVATAPAPRRTSVALIESDVNLRYVVRKNGVTTEADPVTSKPLKATGHYVDFIGVARNQTISFVEA